jgi:hypothetical protein
MTTSTRGYRALLRRLALVGGAATLIFVAGAPAGMAGSGSPTSASARSAAHANSVHSSVQVATPVPTPSPNPTVTNPGPLPPGAPQAGTKPPTGGSLLQRALLASGQAAPASSLSGGPCTLAGGVWTCDDLWAIPGTISAAGLPLPLPIWGFSTTGTPGSASVPGPLFIVTAGTPVQMILHNELPSASLTDPNMMSLEMPASGAVPDTVGIAPGVAPKTYDFGSFAPGTYIYEAGPTGYGARQVRMGLAGIMIVRPANFAICNCAYGTAANAANLGNDGFVDEANLLLNEFDPAFNADPFGSDPIDFSPSVFTVNGQAYDPLHPTFSQINVDSGKVLLLHEANLTDHERGMTIVNERQTILADDSYQLANTSNVATKWLNPGQVSDSFVTVDPSFALGTKIPVYDAGLDFSNAGATGLGGMFAYLDVTQGAAGSTSGPVTSVQVAPTTNSGTEDLNVTGTIAVGGGATLSAAEWFLDDPGLPGSGTPITGPLASFSFTIPSATLNADLISSIKRDGDHVIWVHGFDSTGTGTWGVVSGDVFTYNVTGPVIGELSLHASPTNGLRPTDVANGGGPVLNGVAQNAPNNDLVILGLAGSSLSNFTVTGAEYCFDSATCPNGTGVPLVLVPTGSNASSQQIDAMGNVLTTPTSCVPTATPLGVTPPSIPAAPGGGSVVSLCGTVPAATLLALSQGTHTLYIHACEQVSTGTGACGTQTVPRWGSFTAPGAVIQFVIDKTGPATLNVNLDANPNNGKIANLGNLNFLDSLQVSATFDDTVTGNSNIAYGEVFVTCSPVTQPLTCKSTTGPIDPVTNAAPPDGTGAEMIAAGAAWDSPAKVAYAYIPLAELTAYPEGHVRFWVHGEDQAGNFGPWAYQDLIYDVTPPVFDTPALPIPPAPPTTIACTSGCSISFTAHDPVSGGVNSSIVQAEWFIDQGAHLACEINVPGCAAEVVVLGDPGYGNGTPISVSAPGTSIADSFNPGPLPPGTHIVFRVKDAAGNWSLDNLVVTS